jgi:hypothetical protein
MFRQRLAALAILAAVPFLLLACSSNGSKSGGLKLPSGTTSQNSSSPASDDPTAEDTGDPTDEDTGGAQTGDAASFCKLVDYPDYLMGEEGGEDLNADQLTAKLEPIRAGAPADIKKDVDEIADVAMIIKKGSDDDPKVAEAMMSQEFRDATNHYAAWRKQHCPED